MEGHGSYWTDLPTAGHSPSTPGRAMMAASRRSGGRTDPTREDLMIPARRTAAAALLAAGLLTAGATTASAATAPAERISTTAQLQAHLAKAVALDAHKIVVGTDTRTAGKAADVIAATDGVNTAAC
ncbi:hypothetical protein [Kitasatospora sp. McL0602]|uniref:hypothetical protein n=1 Tax=Kitasatospora sp. McL0602 TaxID=3439530 RepID=UPI003F8B52B8